MTQELTIYLIRKQNVCASLARHASDMPITERRRRVAGAKG